MRRLSVLKATARSKIVLLVLSIPLLLMAFPGCARNVRGDAPRDKGKASVAVLVELFTSEGCSSCPPADKLLADLEQTQPIKGVEIITLSEHVDYWNRLGWKDPFSSAEFTKRQTAYATALRLEDYYTPQMIVDGQIEFVGSRSGAAREAISRAARSRKADLSVALKASTATSVTVTVRIENAPEVASGDTAEVIVAIAESALSSRVTRGENSGRELPHSSVTRKLIVVGPIKGGSSANELKIDLDYSWKRNNMKAVVFVQERRSRRVLGVAAVRLAGEL